MKLKYRGVAYEFNPTEVATVEGKVGGKYRGVPWVQKIPQITQVDRPNVVLKYRGVPYCKGAVRSNDIKAESAKNVVNHPEILPKRPKIQH